MTARLVVTCGPMAGTEFRVGEAVSRIGSGMEMNIRIEGLEAHALTLQRRGDGIHVYNRSPIVFQLGDAPLSPSQSAVWKAGADLRVGNGTTLRLEHAGGTVAKAPAQQPARTDPSHAAGEGTDGENAAPPNRTRQTVLVTGFLLVFGGYLLVASGASTGRGGAAEFHSLIEHLLAAPLDGRLRMVRRGLQRAYNLETLECADEANEEYSMLRLLLVRQRRTDDPLYGDAHTRALEDRATAFVRERLERLR